MLPFRFLIFFALCCLPTTVVRAEPVDLPSGTPVLSASVAEGETMIDAESIDQFASLVLPALEHLVKKGGMPLPAVREIPFPDYSELLWRNSADDATSGVFPFPNARDEGEPDRARSILRNVEALWQIPPALEASVHYLRYRASSEPTSLHFGLVRSYQTAEHPYTANQLFRELVSFESPQGILPLQFLTIRFADRVDRLWERSGPAGTRSLESWLRQERAAGGLFVLDDLLVHSGSSAAYEFGAVQSSTQLVPFSATTPTVTEESDGCLSTSQDGQHPQFNTSSKRFARASGWVPTELVFVPRRVFLIKAFPRSPFAQEAELLIVVDRETMLPVMKIVRSDTGGLLRVVFAGFSMVQTKGGMILPIIRQVVSVTGGATEVDALSFDTVRRCGVERAFSLRERLDTRALLKADADTTGTRVPKKEQNKRLKESGRNETAEVGE